MMIEISRTLKGGGGGRGRGEPGGEKREGGEMGLGPWAFKKF